MKVEVLKDKCIGCGQCESICPDVFKLNDDGLSDVIGPVTDDNKDDVEMALSACPTDAIENA